jgi:hypothetical protein
MAKGKRHAFKRLRKKINKALKGLLQQHASVQMVEVFCHCLEVIGTGKTCLRGAQH